jgi:hypothetical protein
MVSTFCCSTFVCEMSVFSRAPGRILKAGKERVVHGGASVALALDALAGGGQLGRVEEMFRSTQRKPETATANAVLRAYKVRGGLEH